MWTPGIFRNHPYISVGSQNIQKIRDRLKLLRDENGHIFFMGIFSTSEVYSNLVFICITRILLIKGDTSNVSLAENVTRKLIIKGDISNESTELT